MNSIQILSSRISDRIQKKKLRISNEVRLIDFRSSKEQKAERDHCDQQKWTDGVHELLHNTNIPRRALRPGERGIGLQHFQGFVQVSLFFSFLFFFSDPPTTRKDPWKIGWWKFRELLLCWFEGSEDCVRFCLN